MFADGLLSSVVEFKNEVITLTSSTALLKWKINVDLYMYLDFPLIGQ